MHNRVDLRILGQTLNLAQEAVESGGLPFAAILCRDDNVVAEAPDQRHLSRDPTAHPEVVVIRDYCSASGRMELSDCTLYTNVEPCIMCASAIYWAYVARVVFSVSQETLRRLSNGPPRPTAESIANRGGNYVVFSGPYLENEGIRTLKLHPIFRAGRVSGDG